MRLDSKTITKSSQNMNNKPNVLTIAGSDPSGGAGVQADIKVFHSLGVNGLSAITCITSQVPGHVSSVFSIDKDHISMQIDLLNEHYQPIMGDDNSDALIVDTTAKIHMTLHNMLCR